MDRSRKQPTESGWLETPAAVLYYEVWGAGPPLVMLHGNGGSHRDLLAYAGDLARRCRVILMDSRGHGQSRLKQWADGREFTAAEMAEDMEGLLDHLKIRRAAVLGFSDGANTALEFAVRCPERTRAVISISGNAEPSGLWTPLYLAMKARYRAAGFLRRFFTSGRLAYRLEQRRLFASLILRSPALTGERLRTIRAPVLLIAGTWDLIKVSHTRWMAGEIPNSRLVLIRGGTHGGFFRNRSRYLSCIRAFLEGVRPEENP